MPEHTVTEFRGRNKYGHRTRSDRNKRNRSSSPPRRLGNIQSHKYCTYCAPELASSMERRFIVMEENKQLQKDIKNISTEEFFNFE